MILTEKRIRRTRCALITLLIILLTPLCESGRLLNGASNSDNSFNGKEIVCVIDLGDDMRSAHGLETGFSYELIGKFAQAHDCMADIVTVTRKDTTDYVELLKKGKIDILVTHVDDDETFEGMGISHSVNGCSAWITSEKNLRGLSQINGWMSCFSATDEYNQIVKRFFYSTNPSKRAEKGIIAENVSPYDSILKEYASDLGWDWRMLAAVVYQESKFSINSCSHRGAQGLMQVMPRTAIKYGIEDLSNPAKNIEAGTMHLKRLQKLYRDEGMSKDELIKFTLASYNAGEGRISDCRSLATSMNLDCNKWENIVDVIPMMREDTILDNEAVKHGKFQGHETIAYVDNIMDIYKAICKIHPKS